MDKRWTRYGEPAPRRRGEREQSRELVGARRKADNARVSDPAGPGAQPPADALLWRVQGLHHEVVCYAVAADTGVVLCVATNGDDDNLVAESYPTLAAAVERAAKLRASLAAHGLPPESEAD